MGRCYWLQGTWWAEGRTEEEKPTLVKQLVKIPPATIYKIIIIKLHTKPVGLTQMETDEGPGHAVRRQNWSSHPLPAATESSSTEGMTSQQQFLEAEAVRPCLT